MPEEVNSSVVDQVLAGAVSPAPAQAQETATQPEPPTQDGTGEQAKDDSTTQDEAAQKPAEGEGPTNDGTDWKAEARKWESRSKENLANYEKVQEQLKAVGDSANELVTLREQVAQLTADSAKAKREAAVATVIADKRLTPVQAALLQGSTTEELTAHADALLAAFGASTETKEETHSQGRLPREKLHPGSSNNTAAPPEDMSAVADAVLRGGF